jgi:hypothetical protein
MALWGSVDNAANSDIAALVQVSSNTQYAVNRTTLYNNTTANTFQKSAQGNVVVGQFGVAAGEIQAANEGALGHPQHAGWVLRHEGKGLKAGRVWYETLVAMGSMTGDGSDDTQFRDYTLKINTQPSSNSSATAGNLSFTVVAASVPTGASLTYQWQKFNNGWANVSYAAGQYFNPTTATLTANNITANGNVFRVMVMTNGGTPTVYSSNVTISKV